MKILLCTLITILTFQVSANTTPTPTMLNPTYNGSGCPQGSVSTALSPDKTALSVLYDEFRLIDTARRRILTTNCQLKIPIHVPKGLQVSIVQMDYRGFADVPKGSRAGIAMISQLQGKGLKSKDNPPTIAVKNLNGPYSDEIILQSGKKRLKTACGGDYQLVSNLLMFGIKNRNQEQIFISIESLDIGTSPLVYRLEWTRC